MLSFTRKKEWILGFGFRFLSVNSRVTLTTSLSSPLLSSFFLSIHVNNNVLLLQYNTIINNVSFFLSFFLLFYVFYFLINYQKKYYIKKKRIRSASRLPSNASWQSRVLGSRALDSLSLRQLHACQVLNKATWVRTMYCPRVVWYLINQGEHHMFSFVA
jgi:hypothetical protein